MSIDSSRLSISEPTYFHREYENDLGKSKPQSKNAFDQCMRVTQVALPFISLYQPLGNLLSLILGTARTISCITKLHNAIVKKEKGDVGFALIQTAIAVSSVACTILAHPLGMLITTGHDLVVNANHLIQALQKKDYKTALEVSASILNNTLYLGLFFTGAPEILIASFSVQVLLGLYQSSEEFKRGNYLEGCGHLLMSGIRTQQLHTQINLVKFKWAMQSFLNEIKENKLKSVSSVSHLEDKSIHINETASPEIETFEQHLDHRLSYYDKLMIKYRDRDDPFFLDIYRGYGLFYSAIAANDVDALEMMLRGGFPRDRIGSPRFEHVLDLQKWRLHNVLEVLQKIDHYKGKIPYESLEFLVNRKEIHNFPFIFYKHDLRLFLLGNDWQQVVRMHGDGNFFLPAVTRGSCQYVPLSSQSGRRYFFNKYLQFNQEDSEELIEKKKVWQNVFYSNGSYNETSINILLS